MVAGISNFVVLSKTLFADVFYSDDPVSDTDQPKYVDQSAVGYYGRLVDLATEAMDMHFTADGIVSLKAKSKKGSVYDEVYVDDDALYDLIIQTFYTEEQSEGESK